MESFDSHLFFRLIGYSLKDSQRINHSLPRPSCFAVSRTDFSIALFSFLDEAESIIAAFILAYVFEFRKKCMSRYKQNVKKKQTLQRQKNETIPPLETLNFEMEFSCLPFNVPSFLASYKYPHRPNLLQ